MGFLGKKAEGGALPGVVLGFLGVVLVVFSHGATVGSASRHDYLLGAGFIAFASAAYAIATVLAKSRLAGLDPIGLATTQLSLAGLMVLPVALLGPHPAAIQPASFAAAVTLGILGSGVAYLLFYTLLERVSPTRVASVTYLGPIWGLFWGKLAHESIHAMAYVGVGIVIAGLMLLSRGSSPCPASDQRGEAASQGPAAEVAEMVCDARASVN